MNVQQFGQKFIFKYFVADILTLLVLVVCSVTSGNSGSGYTQDEYTEEGTLSSEPTLA